MQPFRKSGDYEAYERAIEQTLETCPLRNCSCTRMPNHWHLVVWPEHDGELAALVVLIGFRAGKNRSSRYAAAIMGRYAAAMLMFGIGCPLRIPEGFRPLAGG